MTGPNTLIAGFVKKTDTWREYVRTLVAIALAEHKLGLPYSHKKQGKRTASTSTTPKRKPDTVLENANKRIALGEQSTKLSHAGSVLGEATSTLLPRLQVQFSIEIPAWILETLPSGFTPYSVDFFYDGTIVVFYKLGPRLAWRRAAPGDEKYEGTLFDANRSWQIGEYGFTRYVTIQQSWYGPLPERILGKEREAKTPIMMRHDTRGFLVYLKAEDKIQLDFLHPSTAHAQGYFIIQGAVVTTLEDNRVFYDMLRIIGFNDSKKTRVEGLDELGLLEQDLEESVPML